MTRRTIFWSGLAAAMLTIVAAGMGAHALGARGEDDPFSLESIVSEAQREAPAEQQLALEDGAVTAEEHEAAIARFASCLDQRGVKVEIRAAVGKRPTEVGFAAPTLEEAEKSRAILGECRADHLNDVERVFQAQARPTDAEAAEGRALIADCMTASGFGAEGEVTAATLLDWARSRDLPLMMAFSVCVDKHYTEFGFWP